MFPGRPDKCSATSPLKKRTAFHKLLVLALLVSNAAATPQQFVSRIATTDCGRHPDTAYGRHSKPVPDVRSSFSFVRLDRPSAADAAVTAPRGGSSNNQQQITVTSAGAGQQVPVTAAAAEGVVVAPSSPLALCAGYSYALDVNFGGSLVNALVSSSVGRLSSEQRPGAFEAVNAAAQALGILNLYNEECPNRYTTPVVTRVANLVLELPEDASGSLTVKATSASGPFDAFRMATVTLPVLPKQQCEAPVTNPDVLTAAPATPAIPAAALMPAAAPAPAPAPAPAGSVDPTTAAISPPFSGTPPAGSFVSTAALQPAGINSSTSSSAAPGSTASQAAGDASPAAPGAINTTVSAPATVAPAALEGLQLLSQIQAAQVQATSGDPDAAGNQQIKVQGSASSTNYSPASDTTDRRQTAAGDQPHTMSALMLVLCALVVAVDVFA